MNSFTTFAIPNEKSRSAKVVKFFPVECFSRF